MYEFLDKFRRPYNKLLTKDNSFDQNTFLWRLGLEVNDVATPSYNHLLTNINIPYLHSTIMPYLLGCIKLYNQLVSSYCISLHFLNSHTKIILFRIVYVCVCANVLTFLLFCRCFGHRNIRKEISSPVNGKNILYAVYQ